MRRVVLTLPLFVAVLALPGEADAKREPIPQRQELKIDFDIIVAQQLNISIVDAQYVFTPGTLNKRDEVVPLLRRFVRHATSLRAGVYRTGSQNETILGVKVGGIGYLRDRFYASGDLGLEDNTVLTDRFEGGYYVAPLRLELGALPLPLVQLGLYGVYRPILDATEDENGGIPPTFRSGFDGEIGATLTFATPADRVFGTFSAGYRQAAWDFTGFHPGPFDVHGPNAKLFVSFQTSPTMSWYLQASGSYEDWNNQRMGDADDIPSTTRPWVEQIHRQVLNAGANIGVIYWFEGRLGFRVALGGGYMGALPNYDEMARGFGTLSTGFVTRF